MIDSENGFEFCDSDKTMLFYGDVHYELTFDYSLDADVGGTDGYKATRCEITHMQVGGLKLNRYQMLDASKSAVAKFEADKLEIANENPHQYLEAAE